MKVFTRAEFDFWCNYLGNDPQALIDRVNACRSSGEDMTINEIRRSVKFWGKPLPDLPGGNVLLNGDSLPDPESAEYKNELTSLATFVKDLFLQNSPSSLSEPKYAKLAKLLQSE